MTLFQVANWPYPTIHSTMTPCRSITNRTKSEKPTKKRKRRSKDDPQRSKGSDDHDQDVIRGVQDVPLGKTPSSMSPDGNSSVPIKLKIRLGSTSEGKPRNSKNYNRKLKPDDTKRSENKTEPKPITHKTISDESDTEAELDPTDDESHSHPDPKPMTSSGTSSRKKGASREDEEEAKWLEALEAGTLDDDGYLATKGKDVTKMTARQMAKYEAMEKRDKDKEERLKKNAERKHHDHDGKEEEETLNEEAMARRAAKAKRRKELSEKKKEADKKQTVDRLLKKQAAKKNSKLKSVTKESTPKVTYVLNSKGASLSFPEGMAFPLSPAVSPPPPPIVLCGVCKINQKRYSCSKTLVPLCSIDCYKINFSSIPC